LCTIVKYNSQNIYKILKQQQIKPLLFRSGKKTSGEVVKVFKMDKRLRAGLDALGGVVLGLLGTDIVRVATATDPSTISLYVNKITETLFDLTINIAKVDGGSSALMVIGGVGLGLVGAYQFYDAFKKLSK